MNINEYIQSIINIEKNNRANIAALPTTLSPSKDRSSVSCTERLEYHSKSKNILHNTLHQLDLNSSGGTKLKSNDDIPIIQGVSSIKIRILEVFEWNIFRIINKYFKGLSIFGSLKKCYEEFRQGHLILAAEKGSNISDESYITASSVSSDSLYLTTASSVSDSLYLTTASSVSDSLYLTTATSVSDSSYLTPIEDCTYLTPIEDFTYLKPSNDYLESEISFDSGIDEGKRDLITRLLQSKGDDFPVEEDFILDCPPDSYETQYLLHDIENERKNWDENISEQIMYEDRIFRFFRTAISISTENSEDPPEDLIAREEFPVSMNTRKYYMNLSDEQFSEFERKTPCQSISPIGD